MEERPSGRRPPQEEDAPFPWMNRVPTFMVILFGLGLAFSWVLLFAWWLFR